mmetsp:Transcript_20750/g.41507  ORF Transcript_20750/g.41507 Transcript_20750/m.41507 type:complete len:261 (+) Transcript_20750:61-843(+)
MSTRTSLQALLDERVDVLTTVSVISTFGKVQQLLRVTAVGVGQLERPQSVGSLLEVWADSVDLVDQVLHTHDSNAAQGLLDDGIVRDGDALAVDLHVTALVDQFANRLERWLAVSHKWLDQTQHVDRGSSQAHKDTVLQLAQTQQLQNLAGLWWQADDTTDADDKGKLWLWGDVQVAVGLGLAAQTDLVVLRGAVLADVRFGALEGNVALDAACLLLYGGACLTLSPQGFAGARLLQYGLGDVAAWHCQKLDTWQGRKRL